MEDRLLLELKGQVSLSTPLDLWQAVGWHQFPELYSSTGFTTEELATMGGIPRWLAQKAAYCFRHMGLLEASGRQGNAILYRISGSAISAEAA